MTAGGLWLSLFSVYFSVGPKCVLFPTNVVYDKIYIAHIKKERRSMLYTFTNYY